MSAGTRARLRDVLGRGRVDLAEANLLIAAEAYPGLDVDAELGRVDALAGTARERGGTAHDVAAALRAAGLRGDTEHYDDPRNSFLNEVLDRGLGLPIALSALTLAVASRVGAPMAGIGMPGHFVVADTAGPEPRYLDPFDGWRELCLDDLRARVEATAGVPFRDGHLAPTAPRAIVLRMLANLEGAYARRRRPADALWTVQLAQLARPGEVGLRAREAALLEAVGRYDEAEAVADGLLAELPQGPDREAALRRRDAIRELRWRMN